MAETPNYRDHLVDHGFAILNNVYTAAETGAIINTISNSGYCQGNAGKAKNLFAMRRFLKELPDVKCLLFNDRFKRLIEELFGKEYFIVKSIYFDKPSQSNWFVAWHQDLTISVDKKADLAGYSTWTKKSTRFAVQPPIGILLDNFTIRIHLDDTTEDNGALRVVPGSHKEIFRTGNTDLETAGAVSCDVQAGGIMIMRPLLMHASNRTANGKQRRVIHIEFSSAQLPQQIDWAEKESF